MAVSLSCPGCQSTLSVRNTAPGAVINCPKCKNRFAVPGPADPAPTPSDPAALFGEMGEDRVKGVTLPERYKPGQKVRYPIIFHVAAWMMALNLAGVWVHRALIEFDAYMNREAARKAYRENLREEVERSRLEKAREESR